VDDVDVAELRRLLDSPRAFWDHLVGLAGSDALLASYRRLPAASGDAPPALVEAYEAGDVELARAALG
jgi:hypothetical protein